MMVLFTQNELGKWSSDDDINKNNIAKTTTVAAVAVKLQRENVSTQNVRNECLDMNTNCRMD